MNHPSTPNSPILEAVDLTVGYNLKPVLHSVALSLSAGEFIGLIGPNGCGKSTLLSALTRILKPMGGDALLEGKSLAEWSSIEVARRIAFVPQTESASFDFTVNDLVLMGRHPHLKPYRGETELDYQAVAEALAEADISHLAERPITQLSGGEHRRVLLARALAQQTPILLLDEPTAHLDITHQVELLQLLIRLTTGRNAGVMAALHDLNQAAEFCDRLILMSFGKILATGTPDEVLLPEQLKTAYSADIQIGKNPLTGRPMILALTPIRGGRGR